MGTIRFLLALAVVCAHVGKLPYTVQLGGLLAVQSFYIISGFLIALVWTNKYQRRSNGLFLFYSNRAARIYILYWAVLVISIVVALVIKWLTHDYPSYWSTPPRGLLPYTIFTNTWIFGSSWAYWLGYASSLPSIDDGSLYFTMDYTSSQYPVWRTMILGPAWTLDLELCFYLLAPLLVGLRLRYILAIIAASLVARFSWYAMGHGVDPWNYRFFPFEIGLFMLGVAAYRVSSIVAWQPSPKIVMIVFTALVGSILEYGSLGLPAPGSLKSFVYLFIFAALIPYIFNLTASWKFDGFLADMSFPLYLVHWPVGSVTIYLRDQLSLPLPEYRGIIPAIASIAAAALLVIFVERPVERWRQSRITSAKAGLPAAGEVNPELSARPLSGA